MVCTLSLGAAPPPPGGKNPARFSALTWRSIGPFRGGRALAAAGVPGNGQLFYMGAAAGGVWRSNDAGASWQPIFDQQDNLSIGAITIAPSNPRIIYVGTGEGALRGDITYGNGVYKSQDGGKSWHSLGLVDTRQIGAIAVDPRNPDVVLVAAIGHAFGPNAQRGIFRSQDGGKTWARTLFRDENTGAIDVVFDPHDPAIAYAALWQVRRQPWNFSSGGPGSGLYRSADGGKSWARLSGHGLPTGPLGRIDISISAASPKRLYAMVEAQDGGLFRSDDAGHSWSRVSQDGRLRQRAWYFSKIFADPQQPDTVYAVNTGLLRSRDGGRHFHLVAATHGDHHFLWIDPKNDQHMIDTNDGGASISLDGGNNWSTQNNQPTAAIYHIADDQRFPYYLYGAQQDNTNLAIATYDDQGVIDDTDWYQAGGGECGFVLPDPKDPQIIVSDSENSITRFDRHDMQGQDISAYPIDASGHPASELKYRFNWTSPMFRSVHDPRALYLGYNVVFKSIDQGNSWQIISPDLTRDDKSKQAASGGPITRDITSVEYYDTLFALAESPLQAGQIWAGSDDGLLHVTDDGGAHWRDVTPPAMPAWSEISMIEPSHFTGGTAFIAVDRHKLDDIAPYAYRTEDAGAHWRLITQGLPDGAVVHAVREDPATQGLLFAGTERGVYVSFDAGEHWQSLQQSMPVSPVHDLLIHGNDLAIATHGRGFWVMDDITPLRQLGGPAAPVVLFRPQTALRLHYPDDVDAHRPVGQTPPRGALIDYDFDQAPAGTVMIDILDQSGALVRHLSSKTPPRSRQPGEWPDRVVDAGTIPAHAGMNRLVWDLRYDDPVQIPGAIYSDQAPRGPLVGPGQYTVRLSVAGQQISAPLTVAIDPRAAGEAVGLSRLTVLEREVEGDIDSLHRAVPR
ncbi:MAG: glycosyl hydrolase [Acidocella sp.]|nr:glycosyl hydrolase [Acidocella sp.]